MSSRTASPTLQTSRKQAGTPTPARPSSAASTSSSKPSAPLPAADALPVALPDLEALLNLPIRVTVAAEGADVPQRDVDGALFAYSPGFVVLSSPGTASGSATTGGAAAGMATGGGVEKRTYHVLKTSTLASVQVLSPTADPSLPPPSEPLSFAHLPSSPAELASAVSRALAARARVGQGVSSDAQALFDGLARTLPVRWSGQQIVVLDEVVVEPPYGVASVRGAKGSAERVERVKKVLEGIRTRLGLTTPQPAA